MSGDDDDDEVALVDPPVWTSTSDQPLRLYRTRFFLFYLIPWGADVVSFAAHGSSVTVHNARAPLCLSPPLPTHPSPRGARDDAAKFTLRRWWYSRVVELPLGEIADMAVVRHPVGPFRILFGLLATALVTAALATVVVAVVGAVHFLSTAERLRATRAVLVCVWLCAAAAAAALLRQPAVLFTTTARTQRWVTVPSPVAGADLVACINAARSAAPPPCPPAALPWWREGPERVAVGVVGVAATLVVAGAVAAAFVVQACARGECAALEAFSLQRPAH